MAEEKDKEDKEQASCYNCSNNFKEEDKLYACEECSEVFCAECAKEHAFVGNAEEEEPDCQECGNTVSQLYTCNQCTLKVCEECIKTHLEDEHMDTFYRIYDSEKEYIADKV